MCASELLKGNPKIPQEWAKCDSGLTRELTNEEFDDKNMNTIDQFTNESDARICLKCLVKWKKFPEEDGKDYLVEDSQLQQPINTMKKEKQNLMLKSCVEFSD